MYKEILFGESARSKILKGVNVVAQAVSSTLGPRGQNVIFEDTSFPIITKDGVTVAKEIFLEDQFENMGAMMTREAAENTNKEAGDGTTSTVVLLQSIINEAHKYIISGMNPILLKKGMEIARDIILSLLDKRVKKIETKEQKLQVATISANNDPELGKLIVEVIENVGTDGVVTVTSSNKLETEIEYIKGTKIYSGFESHLFINDNKRLVSQMNNPAIIMCTDDINIASQLYGIIQECLKHDKKNIILLANKIEGTALAFLVQNHMLGKFTCIPVRVPSFSDFQMDLLQDLAKMTNSVVLGERGTTLLKDATINHIGTCESVIIGRDYTIFSGTEGDITENINQTKALLEKEKDSGIFVKEKLKERLGRLTGSIANIRVGGASDSEQTEIKYRIEDALNATKSAIEEGIVEGGGMALIRCYTEIIKDMSSISILSKEEIAGFDIVLNALQAPLKTIVNNGGGNGEAIVGKALESKLGYNALLNKWEDLFKAGIIDPKKVVRNEVINSIATAAILLTSNTAIIRKIDKK